MDAGTGTSRAPCARALAALGCAAAALLAAAPDALASAVTVASGSRVNVTASGNERNDFVVSHDAGAAAYLVRDSAGIDANGPCTQVDPELASCPAAG